jgi:iron(III) transport system permease protein
VSLAAPPGLRAAAVGIALILVWLVGFPLAMTLLDALGYPQGFTVEHVTGFLERPDEWQALWRSLWISLASVGLAALVGVPLAFLFERTEFPGRQVLGALVALPIALPPLVGVLAFLFLFGESGFLARGVAVLFGLASSPWRLGGPLAILLVHTYSFYVFFYLFARAALSRLDPAALEAAESLGASRWRTLRAVTLPLLRPALAGASLLTFMTSLASFSAPYIFGGGYRVMTTQIVASKLNGEIEMAQVETLTLASLAVLGLWVLRRSDRGRQVVATVRGVAPRRVRFGSSWTRGAITLTSWSVTVALLLPHATLLLISFVPPATWTVETLPPVLDGSNYRALLDSVSRLQPILNSLWMALVATSGALVLGFSAARLAARLGGRTAGALQTLVAVPWVVPGTVFALALSTTFSVDAPWLGRFVLVGTPVILPLAYLVRALPLTGRSSVAGLAQLDPALEDAAASLGAGPWRRLRRIVLPMVRPALVAGASVAFITALGDFVTSIVLYTYDTRPISIEMLSSLRLQETGIAAVYGVLLMALSAVTFLVWGRERVGA